MQKPLLQLFIFLLLSSNLFAQEYAAFDKPIECLIIGNRSFKNENGQECTLESKTVVEILGRGYNKNKGKYYFKNEQCSGFLSYAWLTTGEGFREQDQKANAIIYELKNAQALKELEQERQAKKEREEKQKHECAFTTNEVDVFDKVKIIRTSAQWIADGLHITLYARGTKKEVIFSAIDLGCTSSYKNNRSWVKVMLENNDVLTFYHSRELDCGSFELWGNISNSEIIRLKESPIKAIKMEGTEYNHTITEFDWPTFFIDQLKCFNPK